MTDPAPILLVEDDPALAELVVIALQDLEVDVLHASTGAAALSAIDASPRPRLVLLDLDLPDMRGHDVLERGRKGDHGCAIPVVVLSSSEREEDIARAATLGANSYVVKPPDFAAFRDTIRRTVEYWIELHRAPCIRGAAVSDAPLNLLLLEDSPMDAELLAARLRGADVDATLTRVATREAFTEALDGSWDAIIADFRLPGFDALEALDLVTERGVDVPVIVVTGAVGEEVAVECMKRGAVDYLLKDRLTRLPAALERAIEQGRLRRARRRLRTTCSMRTRRRSAGSRSRWTRAARRRARTSSG